MNSTGTCDNTCTNSASGLVTTASTSTAGATSLAKKDQMLQQILQQQRERKVKRIHSIQFGPVMQLPMTLFMLWMVGNDISIFTIMFVGMAITGPLSSFGKVKEIFSMFEGDDTVKSEIRMGRIIYLFCCFAALMVGLMKLSWMGLLPVKAVDWVDHIPPNYVETVLH